MEQRSNRPWGFIAAPAAATTIALLGAIVLVQMPLEATAAASGEATNAVLPAVVYPVPDAGSVRFDSTEVEWPDGF